ncbi:molecular chaperone [Celerinatantimonas sp. YJH-8]|uniref:molecular chaperone n=1 Tax=Celerinatantimonas sp. YJH-8 TaxID=3228714 RepID=UPI0038C0DA48
MTYSSFAGFDFGTSNCALGLFCNSSPELIELPLHGRYMASTLFAPQREVISGWLYQKLKKQGIESVYEQARGAGISQSLRALNEAILDGYDSDLQFGQHAFEAYLDDPLDCYYVKSPKSFLGATGLTVRHQQQFEDIVAAMMVHLREQVQIQTASPLKKVVIGRPVNFQGLNSEQSNHQAITILTQAAHFAGFEQVEFLYEPLAAGLTYQAGLKQSKRVLVVDIGGGTSDISLLEMGPDYQEHFDHEQLVLGYSGQRIGGNDFDIALNIQGFMPLLGMNQPLNNGQPMPHKLYHDAAAVNNLPAQANFYSKQAIQTLYQLRDDMRAPYWSRFDKLQKEQLTQRLNRSAEQAKIDLATHEEVNCHLDYLDQGLVGSLSKANLLEASHKLTETMSQLIDDVLSQAETQPDVLFLTGGTAHSPVIRQFLADEFKGIEQISGDNFGSVAGGLTRWAKQIFTE